MASTILSASLQVIFKATQLGDNDFGNQRFDPLLMKTLDFTHGTGAAQFDRLFMDKRQIAASSNDDLDLNAALSDAYGAAIAAAEIVGIVLYAAAANTNNVVIGGHDTAPVPLFADTSDKVSVKPGGIFTLFAPNAAGLCTVTATTADILRIANSSSGSVVNYELALALRSA